MEKQRQAACAENEELAAYMWNKRKEMAEGPKGISENIDLMLSKAYFNVCNSKTPIKTIEHFSQIKGVGKWILKLMQGFFDMADSGDSGNEELGGKGRETANGNDFMHKHELIDAAEASELSCVPIMPEKGKGKPGQFGSSPRDWYSGWNCMKTLITKGMVVKSSCPAKYMLTEEVKEVARDCLSRSGLVGSIGCTSTAERSANVD